MSRKNKGKNSMNQDTNSGETTANQEIDQASNENKDGVVEATTDKEIVADATVTNVEDAAQSDTAEEPAIKSQAPTIVKQGTVVSGTTSALGRAIAKETEKKILSQSSTLTMPTKSAFEQKVDAFVAKGNNEQKNMVSVLKRYIEEMPRGVEIKSETARIQQRALWNIILSIINSDEKFRENWRMLISFFRNHSNGSLGDRSVNRYMDHLTNFKDDEKQAFLNVLALISVTVSTPNVKDVHKFIVLDKVLVRPIKADARQRIINFYS